MQAPDENGPRREKAERQNEVLVQTASSGVSLICLITRRLIVNKEQNWVTMSGIYKPQIIVKTFMLSKLNRHSGTVLAQC